MIAALDRLDARYGAWLRERPELGFLLIGVVFVAAAATHAVRYEPAASDEGPEAPVPAEEDPADSGAAELVGPEPHDDPEAYIAQRFEALSTLAERDPETIAAAIVSFDDYLTPRQAAALLADLEAHVYAARYRLRAADAPEPQDPADLTRGQVGVDGGLEASLLPALEREAHEARAHAAELEQLADTTDDPEFAETFRADGAELVAAADAAGPDCACVYAVLLEAAHAELLELAVRAGVRLVDPAPAGSDPATVIFLALPPES